MNELLDKFNEYKSISNYRMVYEFENEDVIEFKKTDFPHLIGLHKLKDIPIIRQFNDKNNPTVSAKFILSMQTIFCLKRNHQDIIIYVLQKILFSFLNYILNVSLYCLFP